MATLQCLKCGSHSFTSMVKIPIGFPREVKFIQCAACGGIVGVQEVHNWIMKKDPDRIDQRQRPVPSAPKPQSVLPPDITTILKRLYG